MLSLHILRFVFPFITLCGAKKNMLNIVLLVKYFMKSYIFHTIITTDCPLKNEPNQHGIWAE